MVAECLYSVMKNRFFASCALLVERLNRDLVYFVIGGGWLACAFGVLVRWLSMWANDTLLLARGLRGGAGSIFRLSCL